MNRVRIRRNVVRLTATGLVGLILGGGASGLYVSAASAATTTSSPSAPTGLIHSGPATIVDGYAQGKALTHGDGNTVFSLEPPTGATCPGDSTNDQWRVQTFMVPADVAVDTIVYTSVGPYPADDPVAPIVPHAEPAGWNPLVGIDSNPVMNVLLMHNDGPGHRGAILPFTQMSFGFLDGYGVPSGTYRIGVTCTLANQPADYWDTEIIVDAPSTKAADLKWRLSTEPASVNDPPRSSSTPTLVVFLAVVVALVVAWSTLRRRRSRSIRPQRLGPPGPSPNNPDLADRQLVKEPL
ncbi:MAG: hypothetical protein JWM34_1109 [Ilumatobacteraceae bacterium]|nr:hypothetical protein [Ilumatobacteraceae bacterium]